MCKHADGVLVKNMASSSKKRRGPYGKKSRTAQNLNVSIEELIEIENDREKQLSIKEISKRMVTPGDGSSDEENTMTMMLDDQSPVKRKETNILTIDMVEDEPNTNSPDVDSENNRNKVDDNGINDFIYNTLTSWQIDEDVTLSYEDDLHELFDSSNSSDHDFVLSEDEEEPETGEDEPNINKDGDTSWLYPGANITLGIFMLLIAVFVTKHNLVGDTIEQLLKIIALALPNDHLLCTNLYSSKRYFRNLKNPLMKHYYCPHCLFYFGYNPTNCPNTSCTDESSKSRKTYFLEVPLINQLENLFCQQGFSEKLKSRFAYGSDSHYRDIHDGSLYKSYVHNNGPLHSYNNISFILNTDGANVFKVATFRFGHCIWQ